jgi:hypothetical protein
MTIKQIRAFHGAEPFEPFVIRLDDGREITVQQRELMMTAPSGRSLFVVQPDDSFTIIDVGSVANVKLKDADGPGRQRLAMTLQTFRDLLRARPFVPFRLVMSSGESYDVRHPEMAMLTRTHILVGIDETRHGVPSRFKIWSLLHVTAVEPIAPASSGPSQSESA